MKSMKKEGRLTDVSLGVVEVEHAQRDGGQDAGEVEEHGRSRGLVQRAAASEPCGTRQS